MFGWESPPCMVTHTADSVRAGDDANVVRAREICLPPAGPDGTRSSRSVCSDPRHIEAETLRRARRRSVSDGAQRPDADEGRLRAISVTTGAVPTVDGLTPQPGLSAAVNAGAVRNVLGIYG